MKRAEGMRGVGQANQRTKSRSETRTTGKKDTRDKQGRGRKRSTVRAVNAAGGQSRRRRTTEGKEAPLCDPPQLAKPKDRSRTRIVKFLRTAGRILKLRPKGEQGGTGGREPKDTSGEIGHSGV